MGYKIILAKSMYADFDRIVAYMTEKGSQHRIPQLENDIEQAILQLEDNPELYQIRPEPFYRNREIRMIPIDDYAIFYRVIKNEKVIRIGRIRHQRQNNSKLHMD